MACVEKEKRVYDVLLRRKLNQIVVIGNCFVINDEADKLPNCIVDTRATGETRRFLPVGFYPWLLRGKNQW